MFTYENYCESAKYIKDIIGDFVPQVLIILGSGLGFMAEQVENPVFVAYNNVPHFENSTAPGHKGRFVFGMLCGKAVAVMQGRMHCYEGYSAEQAAYPVRVCKLLGAHSMVVTNACGGINLSYEVGQLMVISDHIKLFDPNPLVGQNIAQFGPRFCDMSYTYCAEYSEIAKKQAQSLGIKLREGVYAYFPGPQYETPAEIRAMRLLGADACGMSTVPEVISANHCGMKILGLSVITNMAAGVVDKKLAEADVLAVAENAKHDFSALIFACLPSLKG